MKKTPAAELLGKQHFSFAVAGRIATGQRRGSQIDLRAVASGRGGEDEQLNLAQERARLAKEQADGHEIKNRIARGKLIDVDEAEREWCNTLRAIRSTMLAVPSRVRSRLGSLSAAEVEIIDGEIRSALLEASGGEA